jgi:hypothetical protein
VSAAFIDIPLIGKRNYTRDNAAQTQIKIDANVDLNDRRFCSKNAKEVGMDVPSTPAHHTLV